jgi:acetyl-CoA acetyltransferase
MAMFPVQNATRPDAALKNAAAVIGVGTTDYPLDYFGTENAAGSAPRYSDEADLLKTAFDRALLDSGIGGDEIDGMIVCTMGEDESVRPESMSGRLGISPKYASRRGAVVAGAVPEAVQAIAYAQCDTVALLYASTRRLSGASFGGSRSVTGPATYYYFHPWGWSSQVAHWALMFRRYQLLFGATEAELGAIALTLRKNAMTNENAIMRDPMTLDDYLHARYIVEPLRLFDVCLVSDGGVCIILRRSDRAHGLSHAPIHVSGWGDAMVSDSKLHYMVKERLRPQFQEAIESAFTMAGVSHGDIDLFEGYDSSSVQLLNQIEGYGFSPQGQGLKMWAAGHMEREGSLPVNTSGGMLSEGFMHGWSQVVECVRQLRHESGVGQVAGASVGLTSLATSESAHPLILAGPN